MHGNPARVPSPWMDLKISVITISASLKKLASGFRSARSLVLPAQNINHERRNRYDFGRRHGNRQPPPPAERKPAERRYHRGNSDNEVRAVHRGSRVCTSLQTFPFPTR